MCIRDSIGLATQDVLLYSDTIEGNIAYGDGSIKINDVVKFARYSSASDFIAKMPEGYDTIVGERGVGLSGGQKPVSYTHLSWGISMIFTASSRLCTETR